MPSHSISLYRNDQNNVVGVQITVEEDGEERTIKIGADNEGNLQLGGVGPNGEKRGKADPEGNPLGNAIVFESNLDVFNYVKFRSDEDYFKTTSKGIVIDEREFLHIYLQIPSGANGFDAGESRLTIGDTATRTGKPVFIREKSSLNAQQQAAVEQASTQS